MSLHDLSKHALTDLGYLFVGDVIGSGMSRTVYEFNIDPTKVVKIETARQRFQNVMEWELWNECRECPALAKYLAPCRYISDCGIVLIMDKTQPLRATEIPKSLPAFLTDHKVENFGLLDGKVVCHDYGFVIKNLSERLKKWNGE